MSNRTANARNGWRPPSTGIESEGLLECGVIRTFCGLERYELQMIDAKNLE
jgi:hypothetical protein